LSSRNAAPLATAAYDYTAWGEPIRVDGFAADGRWFGAAPETVVSVDGQEAEKLIPKVRLGRRKLQVSGLWRLQPLAWAQFEYIRSGRVGCCPRAKSCAAADRHRAKIIRIAASGLVLRHHTPACFVSLGGYLGLTVGWVEGIELNFFGGVLGLDIRRPALKFPGIGRLGMPLIQ